MPTVAIIGGGISGLAAAHYLAKRGIPSTIFEARPYLGGLLRTEYIDGCIVETGADSWLAAKPWARELAEELGVDLTGSNDPARRTLISKQGRLIPFPEGMQLVAPSRLWPILKTPLLTHRTKLRMALDWFRRPSQAAPRDRSVADLVRSHFGQEAVDYIAEPILSGIYGGSPEDLSAESVLPKLVERERRTGSLVRGLHTAPAAGPLFETARDGLGKFVDALRPRSVVHARVEAVERAPEGFRLRAGGDWLEAGQVIVACESHEAARLLNLPLLAEIRHSSAWIVALGFRRLALQGFGALVPKREGRNLMAATFMDNKFPHRVASGLSHVRAFFRERPADPLRDLREVLGITAEPIFIRTYEWPLSLPQYSTGHQERVRKIEEQIARTPGLQVIGNALHGVGIPDCVRLARGVRASALPPGFGPASPEASQS